MSAIHPSRRGLLGSAGAVALLAASATVHASGDHPDAELLALCAECTALEAGHRAAFDALPADCSPDDVCAAIVAWKPGFDRETIIGDRILALRVSTLAGFTALARLVENFAIGDDCKGSAPLLASSFLDDRVLGVLLRDLAAYRGGGQG